MMGAGPAGQGSALTGVSISNGYVPPTSKVGIADFYYGIPNPASRYARFVSIGTSLKIYNVFWHSFEQSGSSRRG